MTFKKELKKIFKNRENTKKSKKIKRTKHEKLVIENFIKERLRQAAKKGRHSDDFRIIGHEVVRNFQNGELVYLKKEDYIRFASKHFLKYETKRDIFYLEPNIITIYF